MVLVGKAGAEAQPGAMPVPLAYACGECQRNENGAALSCAYNRVIEAKESPGFLAWLPVNPGLHRFSPSEEP